MRDPTETGIGENLERYLEELYRLSAWDRFVPASELAGIFHVAPSTAKEMLIKLAEQGCVESVNYKGVKLTPLGRRIGGEAVRRHRLAERLLTDLLGASPEQAHEEARHLGGFLRGEIEHRVMAILGYPQTCPHGNPLDVGSVEDALLLAELLESGESGPFRIVRIRYETPEFLKYLMVMNLVPGSTVSLATRAPFGGPVTLCVNAQNEHPVGKMVLSNIWVHPTQVPPERKR